MNEKTYLSFCFITSRSLSQIKQGIKQYWLCLWIYKTFRIFSSSLSTLCDYKNWFESQSTIVANNLMELEVETEKNLRFSKFLCENVKNVENQKIWRHISLILKTYAADKFSKNRPPVYSYLLLHIFVQFRCFYNQIVKNTREDRFEYWVKHFKQQSQPCCGYVALVRKVRGLIIRTLTSFRNAALRFMWAVC